MKNISVNELASIGSEAFILDVREDDEFAQAHVPGVTHVPLSALVARAGEVPRGDAVYVMCASGGRSAKATEFLTRAGVNAVNVLGGITEWYRNGHPVAYAVRA